MGSGLRVTFFLMAFSLNGVNREDVMCYTRLAG